MDAQTWTWFFVVTTFTLYLGLAYWSRAGTTQEFYVAGSQVSPLANGMATAADWMSAASFLSMAGIISFMGRDGSIYLMGWTGGYVLLALLLAPYLRKFGQYTVPAFVGTRFDSTTARLVAVLCALFVSFVYVAGQMRGVGIVFSRFLQVDVTTGVVIGMVIVFFYSVLGGMKGITYTQVAQYVVLIFAYLVPAIFISIQLTGWLVPQIGLGADLNDGSGVSLLAHLDALHTDLGFAAYTSGQRPMLDVMAVTAALMLGTAGLPHIIVRFYTVPSVRGARASAGWALMFIVLLYATAPAVAVFARTSLLQAVHEQPVTSLPSWFTTWSKTGLLTFEDKNGDGKVQYYNEKNADFAVTAAERGWMGNELKVDPDIMVLANPEMARLPAWVTGLVAAGGLAAALSTAAGLLLVISTSFSHDFLKRTVFPNLTERGELWWARIAAAGAVVMAGIVGIYPPDFVAMVVAFAFGLAASSFFPVIVLGIFWSRLNAPGAIAGMISGISFTTAYIVYFKLIHPELSTPAHLWWGISPEGIGTVGAALNATVAITVALLTKAPSESIQEMVAHLRVPRVRSAPSESR